METEPEERPRAERAAPDTGRREGRGPGRDQVRGPDPGHGPDQGQERDQGPGPGRRRGEARVQNRGGARAQDPGRARGPEPGHRPGPGRAGPGGGRSGSPPPTPGPPPGDCVLALELLVHGVGGTTPEAMLNDPRTVRVAGDGTAGVHRRADDENAEERPGDYRGRTVPEAYSWANLTSGNAGRALWLLLLPFMVVNLAHWVRPAGRTRPRLDRLYDLLVRLLALSLTVLLVAAACEIAVDLVAWQCAGTAGCADGRGRLGFLDAERGGWWSGPGRRIALAAAVPAAGTGLLWWLSHHTWSAYESQRPALPGQAPDGNSGAAGRPALSLPGFWYGRRLVARLRAAHTATGFLTVAAALLLPALLRDRASGDRVYEGLGWALAALLAAVAAWVLYVADRSCRSEEQIDEDLDAFTIRYLPGCALGGTVLAAVYSGAGRVGWVSSGRLPGSDVFTWIAVTQGLLVALLAFVAWRMHRSEPGRRTVLKGLCGPTVAMIACALGGLMSAGAAHRAGDWLDRGAAPGQEDGPLDGPPVVLVWQAAVIPPVLLVILAATAVAAFHYWRTRGNLIAMVERSHPGELEQPARTRQIARAHARAGLTDKAPTLLGAAALATFALGTVAVVGARLSGRTPGEAARGAWGPVESTAGLAEALGSWLIGAAVILLVTLGRRAYRDPGARRTVGILWDVGTFWPRAAHPFAPPCYAERAVPDLTWRMATWVAGENRKLVLSGHSQGSVLAAAAAWQLDTPSRDKVALLTYGSPLERLYGRYFPAYLGPDALEALHGEVRAWRNLWRETDPIGGPVRVAVDDPERCVDADPLPDPASYGRTSQCPLPTPVQGHSGYRGTPEFARTRTDVLARLLPGAPAATPVPTAAVRPPVAPEPAPPTPEPAAPRSPAPGPRAAEPPAPGAARTAPAPGTAPVPRPSPTVSAPVPPTAVLPAQGGTGRDEAGSGAGTEPVEGTGER